MQVPFKSLTSLHLCSYAKCFLKVRPSAFAPPHTLMRPALLPNHFPETVNAAGAGGGLLSMEALRSPR